MTRSVEFPMSADENEALTPRDHNGKATSVTLYTFVAANADFAFLADFPVLCSKSWTMSLGGWHPPGQVVF
jgi:hypothetical protein